MKSLLLAAAALLSASAAQAEDGFYYGLGLGLTQNSSHAPVVDEYTAKGTDFSVALTAGYRFASAGQMTFGIEGNLDFPGGTLLKGDVDACTGRSPTWCSVDTVARLRGTLTTRLATGELTSSLGVVMAKGLAENGPGNNVDITGRGYSLGLGWTPADMAVRIDVNYDSIQSDNRPEYDRDLKMIGLRVSYMF